MVQQPGQGPSAGGPQRTSPAPAAGSTPPPSQSQPAAGPQLHQAAPSSNGNGASQPQSHPAPAAPQDPRLDSFWTNHWLPRNALVDQRLDALEQGLAANGAADRERANKKMFRMKGSYYEFKNERDEKLAEVGGAVDQLPPRLRPEPVLIGMLSLEGGGKSGGSWLGYLVAFLLGGVAVLLGMWMLGWIGGQESVPTVRGSSASAVAARRTPPVSVSGSLPAYYHSTATPIKTRAKATFMLYDAQGKRPQAVICRDKKSLCCKKPYVYADDLGNIKVGKRTVKRVQCIQ